MQMQMIGQFSLRVEDPGPIFSIVDTRETTRCNSKLTKMRRGKSSFKLYSARI